MLWWLWRQGRKQKATTQNTYLFVFICTCNYCMSGYVQQKIARCGGAIQFPDTDHHPTPFQAATRSDWLIDSFKIRGAISINIIHPIFIFSLFQTGFCVSFGRRREILRVSPTTRHIPSTISFCRCPIKQLLPLKHKAVLQMGPTINHFIQHFR